MTNPWKLIAKHAGHAADSIGHLLIAAILFIAAGVLVILMSKGY